MSFWSRLTGGKSDSRKPQKLDYLGEALALERQGDFDAALTSYRLALREQPANHRVLQNMAIAYTKTGQPDQAIKCYRGALQIEPKLSGAHYGLAFLLLKRGDVSDAAYHLEAFLMDPPTSPEAERWIEHARAQLDALRTTDPLAEGADGLADASPAGEEGTDEGGYDASYDAAYGSAEHDPSDRHRHPSAGAE